MLIPPFVAVRHASRPKYLAVMLIQIQQGIAYPIGTLIDVLTSLLSIATVYYLWRTIFVAQPQIAGLDWREMQAYVLLSNAIFALLGATSMREMMNAIRTGAITTDLLRPYSYIVGQFSQVVGRMLAQGIVSFIFSSGMVPLSFLPNWVQIIAFELPFQGMIYTPLQIYRGALFGWDLWAALGLHGVWIGILMVLVQFLWRRGLRAVE